MTGTPPTPAPEILQGSTQFEDKNGRCLSTAPGISPIPLQKGMKVNIRQGQKMVAYHISDWYYEVADQAPVLHVVLRAVPEPRFYPPGEAQDFIQFLIAVTLFGIAGAVGYVVYTYTNHPTLFWGFIGYYLRWTVLGLILVVGLVVAGTTKGYAGKKRTFYGMVLGLTYTFITLLVAGYWVYISNPPMPLKSYPEDYARYMAYIRGQVESNIILPLASLGWLLGLIKVVGLTRLASIIEWVISVFKKP